MLKQIAAIITGAVISTTGSVSSPQHITEDSPGWNCHTMGNRHCATDRSAMRDFVKDVRAHVNTPYWDLIIESNGAAFCVSLWSGNSLHQAWLDSGHYWRALTLRQLETYALKDLCPDA